MRSKSFDQNLKDFEDEWEIENSNDGPRSRQKDDNDNDNDYYFDDEFDDEYEDGWEWREERVEYNEWEEDTVDVYVPNSISSISSSRKRMDVDGRGCVWFVGGTGLGSQPSHFYKTLLEEVAEESNCMIIATRIPISSRSTPLNHIRLAKRIPSHPHPHLSFSYY